jgi:hypothetical protein
VHFSRIGGCNRFTNSAMDGCAMPGLDGMGWRRIAADTRRLAERMRDPSIRAALLSTAENYLKLADDADERDGRVVLTWHPAAPTSHSCRSTQ